MSPGKDFETEFLVARHGSRRTRALVAVDARLRICTHQREGRDVIPAVGRYSILVEFLKPPENIAMRRSCTAVLDRAVFRGGDTGSPQLEAAHKIYEELLAAGADALLDDRDLRPGVKFKDADLIGVPYRINAGRKMTEGLAEVVERKARQLTEVRVEKIVERWMDATRSTAAPS
jgi:prolyl-tRNA synthetase